MIKKLWALVPLTVKDLIQPTISILLCVAIFGVWCSSCNKDSKEYWAEMEKKERFMAKDLVRPLRSVNNALPLRDELVVAVLADPQELVVLWHDGIRWKFYENDRPTYRLVLGWCPLDEVNEMMKGVKR